MMMFLCLWFSFFCPDVIYCLFIPLIHPSDCYFAGFDNRGGDDCRQRPGRYGFGVVALGLWLWGCGFGVVALGLWLWGCGFWIVLLSLFLFLCYVCFCLYFFLFFLFLLVVAVIVSAAA
jgi:hypothetical protein